MLQAAVRRENSLAQGLDMEKKQPSQVALAEDSMASGNPLGCRGLGKAQALGVTPMLLGRGLDASRVGCQFHRSGSSWERGKNKNYEWDWD